MANEIGTMGITLGYATEATAGSKPSSFTTVANVYELPEYDASAEGLDVTDLSDLEWMRYIPGLKDAGDDISISVHMVESNITAWDALVDSAKAAYASGKNTWFKITVPNWTKSFYFAGLPQKVGFGGASVNEVFSGTLHVTPNQIDGWTE